LTPKKRLSFPAFYSLAVMAVDSMLRGENRAQAGIQRLHDRALVGAERSRVGIPPSRKALWRDKWLGLRAGTGTALQAKALPHGAFNLFHHHTGNFAGGRTDKSAWIKRTQLISKNHQLPPC
jgi:hypothetical protein